MYLVAVDAAKCEGCEECVNNCPVTVFDFVDSKAVAERAGDCEGCQTCTAVCSSGAVTLTEM
ncbi:MAG: 4Fe-4S dicluster domain-containing protein [Nitrospirae bacterium]|nr:4Fe-4S dicluster domain-containing protein [Nitrospirota bacterium]